MVDKINRARRVMAGQARAGSETRFSDEAQFFKTWFDSPLRTGAVSPSGRFLARAMARNVDPRVPGLVVELGPGTGPVTEALLDRGIAPERLVLVEFDRSFCKLLQRRFPGTRIVHGDAYRLADSLAGALSEPVSTVVSSLPLLTRPEKIRRSLLEQSFEIMGPEGVFIQFTYGLASPIPLHAGDCDPAFSAKVDKPVWLNIPPARVWRYHSKGATLAQPVAQPRKRHKEFAPAFGAFRDRQMAPALALLKKLADGGKAERRR